jgi:hypothetical protein
MSNWQIELVAYFVAACRNSEAICARICTRMTTFLLDRRERIADREKSRFPLVNRVFFETKKNVLKSMISES